MALKASKVSEEGLRFFSAQSKKSSSDNLPSFAPDFEVGNIHECAYAGGSREFQKLPASLRPTRPASHRVARAPLILPVVRDGASLRPRPRHFEGSRERPGRTTPQRAAREVLCRHGLCEQRALRQTEAQLTRGEKVGPALHLIGDGACAHGIGEIDDSPAGCPFAAIARATGDELSSDLELDEGKIAKPRKRRPFRSEIAERDGDRAVPK
jgi:hypothetical protein